MKSMVQTVEYSSEILLNNAHFHDCHQIILVLKGNVSFCINGNTLSASAGNAVICSRYENHSFHILSDEYERFILQIEPSFDSKKSSVYSLLTDRPSGFCHVIDVSACLQAVTAIFENLLREHAQENRLASEMEQLLVEQLLITIYRCTGLELLSHRQNIVMDIKYNLENNFSEPYTLERLAKEYGISISSLSHRFRQVTGTSVMDFLQACRMAHAKRLLVESDCSIGQIVERCGFSDNSNFSRTFKVQNGLTPSAFRKKHRNSY